MRKISGKVIKGDGYGRKLGFPTANLDVAEKNLPEDGIYAGEAMLEGKRYRAGIVIGPNRKVEAHLLEFSGDIYGKELTLFIKKFLRTFKKFNNEEKLIIQIKKDISLC